MRSLGSMQHTAPGTIKQIIALICLWTNTKPFDALFCNVHKELLYWEKNKFICPFCLYLKHNNLIIIDDLPPSNCLNWEGYLCSQVWSTCEMLATIVKICKQTFKISAFISGTMIWSPCSATSAAETSSALASFSSK